MTPLTAVRYHITLYRTDTGQAMVAYDIPPEDCPAEILASCRALADRLLARDIPTALEYSIDLPPALATLPWPSGEEMWH